MEVEVQMRRSSSASSSPDFEFWKVLNPSITPPDLLTADELIVDGILLPLHLLSLQRSDREAHPTADPPHSDPPPATILSSSSFFPTSGSRRWKVLFKSAGEKKPEENEKERKKQRKSSSNGFADLNLNLNLNLNIWPFTRSRSAGNTSGNTSGRPRSASSTAAGKVSSAPCSRSNSRGDSACIRGAACRRWASSPGRGGVHLGRSSPVWKIRRTGMGPKETARKSGHSTSPALPSGGGVRVLNLSVNSCIGYRNQVSCRDDDSDGLTGGVRTTERSAGNGNVFSFRALFSKKVY